MLEDITEIEGNVYRITHYDDTQECYNEVKTHCEHYWTLRQKNESYENYRFDDLAPAWSLGPMLYGNKFDLGFSLLYINDNLFSVGGIRRLDDNVALIMGRHYSLFTIKPVTHAVLFPFHHGIARKAGYKQAWVTVNQYNNWQKIWYSERTKSRRLTSSELYKRAETITSSARELGNITINNTEQFVLSWNL